MTTEEVGAGRATSSVVMASRPVPTVTDDSAPFWEAARDGRLVAQRCAGCGELHHPPRPECPRCHIHMTERPIGGGSFGLGYARKREWLICPSCRRSAIYDIKRGTRN